MVFQYILTNSLNKNSVVPAHSHNCYELVYYYQAGGKSQFCREPETAADTFDFNKQLKQNVETLYFSPQTFVIFPPNVVHNEINEKESNILSFGFTVNEEESFILNGLTLKDIADEYGLSDLLAELRNEYYHPKAYSDIMLDTIVTQMFVRLARLTPCKASVHSLDYIKAYVDEYFMTDIDIEKLASMYGYSQSYFRVIFKDKFGVSFKQYILNKRLGYAKKELTETLTRISDIASNTGFKDYYQFSAFFKKATGLSPRAFRTRYGIPPS